MRPLPQLVLDVVLVLLFATIGRRAHQEGTAVAGVVTTAAPFLVGLLVAWGLCLARRVPPLTVRTSWLLVPVTVVVGQALRVALGGTTHWSFVLVSLVALAVLLLLPRAVAPRLPR